MACAAPSICARVRLKLDADRAAPAANERGPFQELLDELEAVRSLHIDPMARSCPIGYDRRVIPCEAWSDFLAAAPSPATAVLEGILREKFRLLRGRS
jgi:hypothetical protein